VPLVENASTTIEFVVESSRGLEDGYATIWKNPSPIELSFQPWAGTLTDDGIATRIAPSGGDPASTLPC